jgi:beta propeller repeat protein
VIDFLTVGWTDGRSISSATPTLEDDWDIYGAPLSADGALAVFPGENAVTTALAAQLLTDVDGSLFVWNDMSEGNWNPVVRGLTGEQLFLSHDPGTQAAPAISGNVVVWMDNRLGSYDVYASSLGGASVPEAGWLVINEILADPAAAADVNGDGTPSTTQDEFVEIVNATGVALDISGLTLSDAVSVRHTFPAGTVIPGLGSIVVFAGGAIGATSIFGGARVQIASSGGLALNNDGDTVSLRAGTTVIDSATYGSAAGMDRSIVRQPEAAATGTFVRHDLATGSAARPYSPGTGVRGFAF